MDDDVHHFTISTVASPQVRNAAFNVTFTAKDINNVTITGYNGTPALSAVDGTLPLAITPATLTGFSSGVKTQSVVVGGFASSAVLTLTDPLTSGAGSSNAFAVGAGPHSRFAWSTIPSPQTTGEPFSTTLTAQDAQGNTVTGFSGPASIQGLSHTTETVIGSGTSASTKPLDTSYDGARSQLIFLPGEIGGAKLLKGISLNITAAPGMPLARFAIRLKHTATSSYPSSISFDNTALNTVYSTASQIIAATGWTTFDFDSPFAYNGTQNLLVDIVFDNASTAVAGLCQSSTVSPSRHLYAANLRAWGYSDPHSWVYANNFTSTLMPNVKLLSGTTVAVAPAATGTFTNGVWVGNVTVTDSYAGLRLRASSGAIAGNSNAFDVMRPPIVLTMDLPATALESSGTFTGSITANQFLYSPQNVLITCSDPGVIPPQTPIFMNTGTNTANFICTLTDDALKNGARNVTLTAEITGVPTATTTDTIQILDDELHDFLIAPVASPQVRGAPFVVTLNARSISGEVIPNFTGSVTLSGSAGAGSLFTPKVLNVSAGSATTSVSIASAVTGAQLTATGTTSSGTSNLFDVASAGSPARLVWGSLASLRLEDEPFTTSLSLRDAFDNPVTNWSGPVDLAVESVRPQGTATLLLSIPIITQLQRCRSQQILTAAELGGAGRITSLTLRIGQAGAASLLQRLTLRLKHTTASSFPTTGATWDNVGFTTVYQADTTLEGSGSVTFRFTTPFDYDGTSALMIDYSFLSSSTAGIGGAQFFGRVLSGAPRLLMMGFISQTSIDPLDWDSGNSSVAAYTAQPDVELGFETAVTSITPSQITVTNGVWSGSLALAGSGRSLRLRATTPALAARSFSNSFELFHAPVLDPEPAYTQGLNNVLTWPAAADGTGFHYDIQRSTKSDFSENVSGDTTSANSWTTTDLTEGQTYYYRMRIRLLGQTSVWSPTVFSTQDASPPLVTAPVAITHGSTGAISGTVWDLSHLYTITVGSTHIAPDGYGRWSHLVTGLTPGANTFDVTFIDNAEPPNSITVPVTIVRTSGDGHTPPSFHTPPQSTWGIIGREVRIRPIVLGSRPLDFIWKKDSKLMPVATSAELVLPAVKTADAGRYRLEVQAPGSTTPPVASDFDLLLHTALPARLHVKQNGSAKLSTTVTLPKGVPTPTYRWIKPNGSTAANENYGGTNITGAVTSTLAFANATPAISGRWLLQIASGSVTTEQSVEVVVQGQVPVITPPASPMEVWVSQLIDLTLSTTGLPTGFTATGVPAGLTFDKTTGRLSGRLTTASKIDTKTGQPIPSVIKLTATNTWGTSAPVELRLIISDHFGTLEGGWSGLIARDSQTNFNLGGILEMTVAKTGIATGSVILAGQKHSFVTPLEPAESMVVLGQKSARITFKLPRTKPVKLGDLTVSILLDSSNSSATLLDAEFLIPSSLRYYGDGISGTDGDRLSQPRAMVQDSEGVIYITNASETGTRIRTLSPFLDELQRTFATLPGTLPLSAPAALLLMPDGSLLFTDPASSTLRQRFPDGSSLVWAGNTGSSGHADAATRRAALFRSPTGLCMDPAGNVYVTDTGSHVIRKITPSGIVTTLAGKANTLGHADGAGAKALFRYPVSILYEPLSKTLLVADVENSVIRRVTLTGTVTTYIGSPGIMGAAAGIAGNARLSRPTHLVTDGAGTLFFTDDSGIWQATPTGIAARIGEAVLTSSIKGGLLWSAADRQLLLTDPHGHTLLQYQLAVPILEGAHQATVCPLTRTPATQNIPAGLFNLAFVQGGGPGPLGDSFAALNISSKGIGSFTGRQSDGQTWTASSPLNQARELFINPLLNKGTASVHGRIIFEPDSSTISISEQITWMKLPQPLSQADLTYPEGFDLQLGVLGNLYTPGNLHLLFGLSSSPGSLGFMASEYGLSSLLDQPLSLTAPNALKVSTPNSGGLVLTINPATGLITGKFQTDSPARTATMNGLLINEGTIGSGRGHILLPESTDKGARMNSGTFIIAPSIQ
jgi:sugar lactone lactonase YvrE